MQPKVGGKLHLRLNTATSPIANKYREGKLNTSGVEADGHLPSKACGRTESRSWQSTRGKCTSPPGDLRKGTGFTAPHNPHASRERTAWLNPPGRRIAGPPYGSKPYRKALYPIVIQSDCKPCRKAFYPIAIQSSCKLYRKAFDPIVIQYGCKPYRKALYPIAIQSGCKPCRKAFYPIVIQSSCELYRKLFDPIVIQHGCKPYRKAFYPIVIQSSCKLYRKAFDPIMIQSGCKP
ncbi:hypothetical protein CHS0354_021056 [Potamilus streckersoni]|uniref:Uncharacterized protein n=1 Tax=Potamilus streckersoni TaxID=2493646 RepID=A0AAE0SE99_9BIVA|nr:hypothetical protein CHS0354_021056 [Potamilus streckersoni]